MDGKMNRLLTCVISCNILQYRGKADSLSYIFSYSQDLCMPRHSGFWGRVCMLASRDSV